MLIDCYVTGCVRVAADAVAGAVLLLWVFSMPLLGVLMLQMLPMMPIVLSLAVMVLLLIP